MRILLLCLIPFLWSCGPAGPPQPVDPMVQGQRIYFSRCATCHGRDGRGTLRGRRYAADFTEKGGVLSRPDAQLSQSVMNGLAGQYGQMPAFKPILTQQQVEYALAYIRAELGPK